MDLCSSGMRQTIKDKRFSMEKRMNELKMKKQMEQEGVGGWILNKVVKVGLVEGRRELAKQHLGEGR